MGKYSDVKTRLFLRLLKKLAREKDIIVHSKGRKRHTKIECIHTGRSYPLPLTHNIVKEPIVKGFIEWLIENGVCTEQEAEELI